MRKTTKELLFERMNTIGGMPLKEDNIIIKNILDKLNIINYKILGSGQHGTIVELENNKCMKITTSENEINIVKQLKDKNLITFPEIYKIIDNVDNLYIYIRDCYEEIDYNLEILIDDNLEEIEDFLGEKRNWDAVKSNTNLVHYFDEKFLHFLSQLKKDLYILNALPNKWDIAGLSSNLYKRGDSYVLADF